MNDELPPLANMVSVMLERDASRDEIVTAIAKFERHADRHVSSRDYRDAKLQSAERSKRYREAKRRDASRDANLGYLLKKESKIKKESKKDISDFASRDVTAISKSDFPKTAFDEFWQAYPKRVGRKAALKSFERIRKTGEVPWERLIAAARNYAGSSVDPQFTKHPATWLNAGCWDDQTEKGTAEASDWFKGWTPEQIEYGKLHVGWRPGLPTAEEMREKRNGNGTNHVAKLRPDGAEIRSTNGQSSKAEASDDSAGERKLSHVGELF